MSNQETTKDGGRLPLTRSLEAKVLANYTGEAFQDGLRAADLLPTLAQLNSDQPNLLNALSEVGSECLDRDSLATLCWIDATFTCWENRATLAPEMQQLVNRCRPLAAAFALTDSRFFTPGGHGLHRLLDVFYDFAKGWHSGLGNAGLKMLTTASDAVDRINDDFPSEARVDETRIFLEQKIHDHQTHLEKLDALLLQRELASLGNDATQQAAAWLINTAISQTALPESVAQFIASDWYASGVCIAQAQGFESPEWRTFMDTTQLLVDAVQPVNPNNGAELHRLYMAMQQISITLSKQLVSLQGDTVAIADAVGLIEYAMLRNLRGEDLGLQHIDCVIGSVGESLPITSDDLKALNLVPGHWFLMQTPEQTIRLRFTGTLIDNHFLLFMDPLGNRALRRSLVEFRSLVTSGEARCLEAQDSFCLAMTDAIELHQHSKIDSPPQSEPQFSNAESRSTPLDQPNPLGDQCVANTHDAPSGNKAPEQRPAPLQTPKKPAPRFNESHYDSDAIVKLQIPMGTWLGFHDRDPPLMAKIVACDLDKNSYIFTNRDGIKIRELTVPQLVALIDRDMVDILERQTNFRESVSQLFQQQERLEPHTR
ncbi:MAG: DUF1631 family protein [Luminiphilus sp.]|nr:DUF1631 family protein [Luminiphilus sp.]